jgi:Zn-dependent protease
VDADWLLNGLVQYVVLIFSMTVHEAAHAWWAMRSGDLTAYQGGQVSLDPIPHIKREPFGMVLIPIVTYIANGWMMGWASAPLSLQWIIDNPRRAAAVSLAGPLANLAIAIATGVLIRGLVVSGAIGIESLGAASGGLSNGAGALLWQLFFLNTLLFTYNLLPIPPLDGASVLGLFMSDASALRLQETIRQPVVAMLGLMMFFLVGGRLAGPVIRVLLSLLFAGY